MQHISNSFTESPAQTPFSQSNPTHHTHTGRANPPPYSPCATLPTDHVTYLSPKPHLFSMLPDARIPVLPRYFQYIHSAPHLILALIKGGQSKTTRKKWYVCVGVVVVVQHDISLSLTHHHLPPTNQPTCPPISTNPPHTNTIPLMMCC
ncbi:hypothetical protein B0T21DRAFT_117691 [Apiosordaria backusii]|uniref:Uncharacterized protein n=1 Tax=Apiosordaria backusii TaxID=314023 RepID=A0AA40K0P7_9PEZI|nr:hypothetical protein B0T21DRAFT_117691 [Apiosordaria backusii]